MCITRNDSCDAKLLPVSAAVSEALARTDWSESSLDEILAILHDHAGVSSAVYLGEAGDRIRLAGSRGWDESDDEECKRLFQRGLKSRVPFAVASEADAASNGLRDSSRLCRAIVVPLLARLDWLGGCVFRFKDEAVDVQAQISFARTIGAQLAQAIASSRATRQAKALDLGRFKAQLMAEMSHDLRTPLNAIIGFSELLQREIFGPLLPRQKEYVANIFTSGHHLLKAIDKLMKPRVESRQLD